MKKGLYLRTCKRCNKQFQTKNRHDNYCLDCRYIKICKICGKEFNERGNVICLSCREKSKIEICPVCGKEFKQSRKKRKTCSIECGNKLIAENNKTRNQNKKEKLKFCKNCKKHINSGSFCSDECKNQYKEKHFPKKIRYCKQCGNIILDRHSKLFCSNSCYQKWRTLNHIEIKPKVIKQCVICGKEFTPLICHKDTKTCSLECGHELSKRTMLEKYGVDNPSYLPEVQQKISNSLRSRSQEEKEQSLEKSRQTKLGRYGNEFYTNIEKTKETWLKKYGVDNPLKVKEIKERVQNTWLEKYGNKNPFKTDHFKKKASETWLEKYGVEQIGASSYQKEKANQTLLKKYGTTNLMEVEEIREKIKQTNLEKYGVTNPMSSPEIQKKAQQTNLERYGVKYNCMTKQCREASPVAISKINLEFSKYLKDNGYDNELEFSINDFSFDIHILNTNILIEIDPAYTHNSTRGPQYNGKELPAKDKYYHYNKTKLALDNGYICIHKFNWITKEQILKIIKTICNYNISQEEPRLHWYNMKTRKHILDNESLENMVDNGFVSIYDDGIVYNKRDI